MTRVGALIAEAREHRGWSQARLAAVLAQVSGRDTVDRHSVSRWERGARTPQYWLPYLARVLCLDLAELERAARGSVSETGHDEALGVDHARLAFLARRPRSVDRAALAALASVLASIRRLEDTIGAEAVLAPVREHVAFASRLAHEARGTIRRDVVDQAGQWAQYLGWLYTALERYDTAEAWFSRSLEWAAEAENDDLAATGWSYKGHIAWLRGQPGPTIGLSQVARRYRGIYTRPARL